MRAERSEKKQTGANTKNQRLLDRFKFEAQTSRANYIAFLRSKRFNMAAFADETRRYGAYTSASYLWN